MKSFKQYIDEGLRRTQRLYQAAIKKSREEDAARNTFDKIMGTTPEERLKSALVGREPPSTTLFNKGDTGVLRMMARAAAKPKGEDITPFVKNVYNAVSTGSDTSRNMGSKMKKIRTSIDLMRAGDRGEYGSLIPEI